MKVPKELSGEAAKFWKRNAASLAKDGRLHEATRDGFVLLCQMWQRYVDAIELDLDAIKIVALSKQVQQLMASFGMTPLARKRLKLDEKDENVADVLSRLMGDDDAE